MKLNNRALNENLRDGVMSELTALSNLIKRVEKIDLQSFQNTSVDPELFDKNLQKMFSKLRPLSDYLSPQVSKQLHKSPLFRSTFSGKPKKFLTIEINSIIGLLSELRRRVNSDDLRLIRLKANKNFASNQLNFYRQALQDLLATTDHDNGVAPLSERQIFSKYQHAKNKLFCYVDFPQSYVAEFDEDAYLASNPDLQSAILKEEFPSGLAHFVVNGLIEVKNFKRNTDINDPIHQMVFPKTTKQFAQAGKRSNPVTALTPISVENYDNEAIQESLRLLPKCSQDELQVLRESKLIDEVWYKRKINATEDSEAHFYLFGSENKVNPNAFFDYSWYSRTQLLEESSPLEAVLHYIRQGNENYLRPGPSFEPEWYKESNDISMGNDNLLAHYLTKGRGQGLSPNSVFDIQYYLDTNADVKVSNVDPIEHFYTVGFAEDRDPSANFNLKFYRSEHLDGSIETNPVTHYLENGKQYRLTINSQQQDQQNDIPLLKDMGSNLRYFSNKGPDFEEPMKGLVPQKPLAKAVAFFLPQFYPFAENDKWWGEGFTEWRNVARGAPRFEGHYQPRIPRDLGFYNLTDESTLIRQSELALANGIEAFCFYYYWFNGKRLMDKPLDLFAESSKIDQEFCIMWANENWTRTWDGFAKDVLIEQNYLEEDEDDFIADTLKYFENDRYLSVDGRPLFILYRPGLVDSAKETIERWRLKWKETGDVEPLVLMVQGFDDIDPTIYGLDGAVEFPPHKVAKGLQGIQDKHTIIDSDYTGSIYSYKDVVNKSLSEPTPEFPLIKTVSPHWDNDARREGCGFTLHGSTPANYQHWLRGAINHARKNPLHGESLVFVNAWNEWAEGAYLEPDVHYGHAYLNATKRALHGINNHSQSEHVLFVGHDAYKHGAQMILLNIAKTFKNQFGFDVTIALKRGGPLLKEYEKLGKVFILEDCGEEALIEVITEKNCELAITNTSVTGDLIPSLKNMDVKVVSLIHELPRLIAEYNLEDHVKSIASNSDHVVFPSSLVHDGFVSVCNEIQGDAHIIPQGIYQAMEKDSEAATKVRLDLGITQHQKMVLNVGYADMRKGFDLFLSTARNVIHKHLDVHFVWVGGMTEDFKRWSLLDLDGALQNRIHIIEFTEKVSDYYNAADCFYLSSREDPYPSVVLEALSVGCPAVIYSKATGLEKVVSLHGEIVDRNSDQEINDAIIRCLFEDTQEQNDARIDFIEKYYQYDDYCFSLLNLARPDIQKVSVVVPNYNYAEHIESRLTSVFNQRYPLFEIIVLDDKSSDKSLKVIEDVIKRSGRKVKLITNTTNSGNTFHQWQKGLNSARGDLLWIAEADDLANSRFVSEVTNTFTPETNLGFTDSKLIDSKDEIIGESYNFYYQDIDAELFKKTITMNGEEFVKRALTVKNCILNVSSVIWRTQALRDALAAEREAVLAHKLVGDWRLYLSVLLAQGAQVTYLAKPLNTHRRHAESVTHAMDAQTHLDEISAIHKLVHETLDLTPDQVVKMSEYIEELRIQFGLDSDKIELSPYEAKPNDIDFGKVA